jgi:hypothetical protein
MHELDCDQLKTMKELLNIATRHASGEEAIGAVFIQGDGKRSPKAVGGHRPKPPAKVLREAPKVAKRGKSGTFNLPQLLPVATTMMTRKWMTLTRSMSWLSSVILSTRHSRQMITSRNISKQPVQTMRTPSSTNSKSAP